MRRSQDLPAALRAGDNGRMERGPSRVRRAGRPSREGDALVQDNADEADCEAASESEWD